MIPVTSLSSLGKCGLISKKFFHPPKNVPNHYSELHNLKGRKFRRFDIFFEDGAKVKRD